MTEQERRIWERPKDFPEDTYERQVKVNCSTNGKTVTGHEIMTIGKWWIQGMGIVPLCMCSIKAPEGLPLTDETTPIGTPFRFTNND